MTLRGPLVLFGLLASAVLGCVPFYPTSSEGPDAGGGASAGDGGASDDGGAPLADGGGDADTGGAQLVRVAKAYGPGTEIDLPLRPPVRAGNLLVVFVTWHNVPLLSRTLRDDVVNVFKRAASTPEGDASAEIYYVTDAKPATALHFDTTLDVSSNIGIVALEYSGRITKAPTVVGTDTATSLSVEGLRLAALPRARGGIVVAGFADVTGTGEITLGSGLTERAKENDYFFKVGDQLAGDDTSFVATATLPRATVTGFAVGASFR